MNYYNNKLKGFTLVELLIVIALIAILSVAVLATINPIEQANKAKDSSTQNDAAEVLNAYERYYSNAQQYPWMKFNNSPALSIDSAVILDSSMAGFGVCYADKATAAATSTGVCNTTGTSVGELVTTDELKSSFAGKAEFVTPGTNGENKLWVFKDSGSSGSLYVCYVPKAKVSRQMTEKLVCLNNGAAGAISMTRSGSGTCVALGPTDAGWSNPTLDGVAGMFRCVPE